VNKEMPYPVLAIDCARGAGSLVLALSATDWRGRVLPSGQSQASDLLPEAQALLQSAGLSMQAVKGFVLGQGPGSFTGLRIAAGLVQGLARGLGVGVACVSGFFAMAYAHTGRGTRRLSGSAPVDVYFDARLGEYFYAQVRCAIDGYPLGYVVAPEIFVGSPTIAHPHGDAGAGRLIDPQPDQFPAPVLPGKSVADGIENAGQESGCLQSLAAWSLAVVADATDPASLFLPAVMAQPLYVREKVAQTRQERDQGPALLLHSLTSHDLASVMVIENAAYPFPWSSGNFRDALAAGYTAIKLVDQGAMVGYCVYMRVLEEAHLLNFTIAPPRQRRGLGQAFLERLLARMSAEGAASILLEVRPSNAAGIGLYRRNGFEQIGRRKAYYPAADGAREDALLMQRALIPQAEELRKARARVVAAAQSQEAAMAIAQVLVPELRS